MATVLKKKPKAVKTATSRTGAPDVLYLYAISEKISGATPALTVEGIDGAAPVEGAECEGYVCWISRVNREEFADSLTERMQNLEWLASAGLRHQRVVSAISQSVPALPARFGTVFLSEASMAKHMRDRKAALKAAFDLVADADEWGIKVFDVAKPKTIVSGRSAPASGVEYLKRKAETLQPKRAQALDKDVRGFGEQLRALAVASSAGGKASTGQPGLLWHGSFLIRRKDRGKLEAVLKTFATKWLDTRRIDWSGPWPPYSFVGGHDE